MIVELTDLQLIKSIITHGSIWPYVHDDLVENKEDFYISPPVKDFIYYLGVKDNKQIVGLFMLNRCNSVTYEIHTCLLKAGRGEAAIQHAKDVVEWIFNNTQCQRLITQVPENNSPAYRLALAAGLTQYGLNENAFKLKNKLQSIKLLGISRGQPCQLAEA